MNRQALLAEGVRVRRFIYALAVCALAGLSAFADTLRVPTADRPTIQSAIVASEAGDTVEVAPGTYIENINFLGKAITVRSPDPDDPNTVTATIIDGSAPTDPNHASVITFSSGEGNDSILEGFTITGGTGTWLAISWQFHEIYWNRCGGGIVCYNLSEPTIRKNRIISNLAGEGGGLYVYGNPVNPFPPVNPPVHLQPVIAENLFENNSAIEEHGFLPPDEVYTYYENGDGGAIVCFQGVDPVITGNTIRNNHARYYGGGIHLRQWSNGMIENNLIENNNSSLGAGIHITYTSHPIILENRIIQNLAGPFGGGGIFIYYYSNPLVDRNLIINNSSSLGAGIGSFWGSRPVIINNLIAHNNLGAGIHIDGASIPQMRNNTIAANDGGGIIIKGSYSGNLPVIHNNLIASNKNSYGINASITIPILHYNNVWDHPAGNYNPVIGDQTGINGNISIDPNLAGPDDFHLLPVSPCRDTGDPGTSNAGTYDIDGEERIANGRIDIGADEIYFSPADFNSSGRVDLEDLRQLADEWLSDEVPLVSDLAENDFIDFNDLDVFSREWLWKGAWAE